MTIPRPAPLDPITPTAPHARAPERGPAGLLVLAASVAVAVALIAPGRDDGRPDDAVSEGIAVAARCDASFDAPAADGTGRDPAGAGGAADGSGTSVGTDRWAACIDGQLRRFPAHPVAVAGLHFHAWQIAERAVASGTGRARALRDRHLLAVSKALNGNLISLHRLCAAAAADCGPIAERLARQV
jgi:hypothetical protein